jgi:integrase/recombinase XerC
MLAVCNDRLVGCRDRAIVLTFVDTGLRLSELAGIQLSDIDIRRGTIRVTGKGSKQRLVHMVTETQKAILKYLLQRRERYERYKRDDTLPCLWVTEECRPLQPEGIRQVVLRLGRRVGITGVRISPHTFRHTFAILALRNSMGEFALQRLLGHSILAMTRRYTATFNDDDAILAHTKASPVAHLRLKGGK